MLTSCRYTRFGINMFKFSVKDYAFQVQNQLSIKPKTPKSRVTVVTGSL